VFYKTHKTGSTAIANLFYRYSATHQRNVFAPTKGCQHLTACLPEKGGLELSDEQSFDMALHHFHRVGERRGIDDSVPWSEKKERYTLAARTHPIQLMTVLRDPAQAFFSKYEYFNLKQKAGTVKEAVVDDRHREGQTRDFGIFTDDQLSQFIADDFPSAFIFIIEELSLSLALWKLGCNLAWTDVLIRQSNVGKNHALDKNDKKQARMGLVVENHPRDYSLYNAALQKLHEAAKSYPNQAELEAATTRISAANFKADEICMQNTTFAGGPTEPTYCKLMDFTPLKLAAHLNPTSSTLDLNEVWGGELGDQSLASILNELASVAELFD
jgi:hypothetical protein